MPRHESSSGEEVLSLSSVVGTASDRRHLNSSDSERLIIYLKVHKEERLKGKEKTPRIKETQGKIQWCKR